MSRTRKLVKIGRRYKPGAVPGQVIPEHQAGRPAISLVCYGPGQILERHDAGLDEIAELRGAYPVIWIDITQFGDADLILRLGDLFGLHHLALEDVVNTHQRPKAEEYGDHLFVVARMLSATQSVDAEQVAFFLGEGYLITFQEKPGDCFEPVRERIRAGRGRIRGCGADYLFYALVDAIIDAYFPALERSGEMLEDLEDAVVKNAAPSHVAALHDMKRDLFMLRRAVWPHREMVNALVRDEHGMISADTRQFLRDCYDHTVQLMDLLETYREVASSLVDVYMSSVSVRLNEVMKVLTIVATIFMPLSFIASLYGMNFDRDASPWNMPELGWYFGYPFALLLMAISAGCLVWYSWYKGWMFSRRRD